MKVVVLGAGVVGVATAYFLNRAGHAVTVVDRQPGAGLETSFANGGQISVSHSEPWANPSVIPKALKWLGRKDSPLLFRLKADPHQWAWGLRFLRNCTAGRARINTERALRIALYSRGVLQDLRAETGLHYDEQTRGILHIYRDAREFDHAVEEARLMSGLGCRRDPVDADGCVAIDPAFAACRDSLVGGIYTPDDESGDAHKFTRGLAALCADRGVEFRYDTTIRRLVTDGDSLSGVETDKGTVSGDAYVLSLGSYGPLLTRPIGVPIPVYPAKGYSVTLPVTGNAPFVSLTDDAVKMVYSRLGDKLRIAGTAEFTGYDTDVDDFRARLILDAALGLFPDAGDPATAEFWAGLRPKTPDSVPIIGRTRYRNLVLNTGHGTLGWTMSCGSGRLTAALISGETPEISMDGYGPERF